jgi:hypothetical protein
MLTNLEQCIFEDIQTLFVNYNCNQRLVKKKMAKCYSKECVIKHPSFDLLLDI